MASIPSSGDVYNNATAMRLDSRTPGTNSFLVAWSALQSFTGPGGQGQYNQIAGTAIQIGTLQR